MSPFCALVSRAAVQPNGEVVSRFEKGIVPLSSSLSQQFGSLEEVPVDFDVVVFRLGLVVRRFTVVGCL